MFQTQRRERVYDVVVIGSGAGGGTVVQVLTQLGIEVALLEAGPMLHPEKDFREHQMPVDFPHRGAGEGAPFYFGKQQRDFFEVKNSFWDNESEPYTVAPGSQFRWFRSRIIGGRTNHYGRISLRFAEYDFNPYSRDGMGVDWPIKYADVAPYYDKAESFIGVHGSKEGILSAPDGIFQPPPALRVPEILIQKSCQKLKIPCIPARRAMITKPLNERAACHYCGQCGRGCLTASAYSSSQVQIFPAMKTGKLTVITDAMARELISGDDGKIQAVSYIDKTTRTEKRIRCRTVVLAAGACETARLLLNSKSGRFPNGIANSSGQVGRNLTDSVGFSVSGHVPALEGLPRHNADGVRGSHVYVPWWLYDKKNDFARGYHIELGGNFRYPSIGAFHGACSEHEGFGKPLKDHIYREYGASVGVTGRGEMIPNAKTFCEIDPNVVDRWGIPVLRFHFAWGEEERKMAKHMEQTFRSIIEGMGGKVRGVGRDMSEASGLSIGGSIIHELGTARMGKDSRNSAVDGFSRAHDHKNLFLADAAPFASNPDKNPTLTIIALAWRMSEFLAEEMRQGNV
jgi:choline dehydrogenase-like flavoprotein